ncbi:hypothetical protein BZA77DRAFT_354273 [Pyronema omphalodes]|nr:hypothetical protein BZA77DRAFT_354273 [Pyronema omphalodes]
MLYSLAIIILPLLALAHPAVGRGRGTWSTAAAGEQLCITSMPAVMYSNTTTTSDTQGMYVSATTVQLKCYTSGEPVKGNKYWDLTTSGQYIHESAFKEECAFKLQAC